MYHLSLSFALGSVFFLLCCTKPHRQQLSVPIKLFEIPADESQPSSFVCEFHLRTFPNCALVQPRVQRLQGSRPDKSWMVGLLQPLRV